MLILPDHPDFNRWLAIPPPSTNNSAFVAEIESGVLKEANEKEFIEYVFGGEYDERLEFIGENDDFF
jgi:DNA/RNA endonuclease G (NUC1)